jgi:hypothetical protein
MLDLVEGLLFFTITTIQIAIFGGFFGERFIKGPAFIIGLYLIAFGSLPIVLVMLLHPGCGFGGAGSFCPGWNSIFTFVVVGGLAIMAGNYCMMLRSEAKEPGVRRSLVIC